MYNGLGVEQKMLSRPSSVRMRDLCGTPLMHPSATRAVRAPTEGDANQAMRSMLAQYADLIERRRRAVSEDAGGVVPDMRTGWLLWQPSLREFLYFEEEMLPPDPQDYFAEWKESSGGSRIASRNLWVYERETGEKRYSITTSAGVKIQPYFDVPPPGGPNLYIFRVQGEEVSGGLIRIWVTASTARELAAIVGNLTVETVGLTIENAAGDPVDTDAGVRGWQGEAVSLHLAAESYELLTASFPGVSDEHMVQLLVERLRRP